MHLSDRRFACLVYVYCEYVCQSSCPSVHMRIHLIGHLSVSSSLFFILPEINPFIFLCAVARVLNSSLGREHFESGYAK